MKLFSRSQSNRYSMTVVWFVLLAMISEAVLIQQISNYFTGGSLNRIYSLDNGFALSRYFGLVLVLDLTFYFSLFYILDRTLRFALQLNRLQRLFTEFYIIGIIFSGAIIFKYGIFSYFGHKFDVKILKELAGGAYLNIFHTLDGGTVLAASLGVVIIMALLFFGVRLLGSVKGPNTEVLGFGRRGFTLLSIGWFLTVTAVYGVGDVDKALLYGTEKKVSFQVVERLLSTITDFDDDGYSPFSRPSDPDSFNKAIYPYATEILANGIDENGLAGDLKELAKGTEYTQFTYPSEANRNNVVLIVVESFKVRPIGATIDGVEVTPFLNSLARDYAYTDFAVSNYGVTSRSIQTAHAGKIHFKKTSRFVPHLLKEQGYKLYAVSAQNENWGTTEEHLSFPDFDFYYDAKAKVWDEEALTTWQKVNSEFGLKLTGEEVNRVVFSLIDKTNEPFFLYLNYQDLHYPYFKAGMDLNFISEPHTYAGYFTRENRVQIERQYLNAASNLDEHIRELFLYLKKVDQLGNTTIVIVGDHPDSLYENNMLGHGWSLDEYQRRTPLFVVNGKGTARIPIGQDEIASLLFKSLDASLPEEKTQFVLDPSKDVFELTGTLLEPRQIAWISIDNLTTYDFLTGLIQFEDGGEWYDVDSLDKQDKLYERYERLVNRWETEMLLYEREPE